MMKKDKEYLDLSLLEHTDDREYRSQAAAGERGNRTAAPGSRRRKRAAARFTGKQAAAMCLCAAILGGAAVGSFQKTNLQIRVTVGQGEEQTPAAASDPLVSLSQETGGGAGQASGQAGFQLLSTTVSQAGSGGMDVSGIAAAALPSVVSITNTSVQEVQQFYNRFGRNWQGPGLLKETTSCGSGVIIAQTDGYLYMVTNNHVVEDATILSVSFVDGSVYDAELCGTDENLDLAVIKVALDGLSSDTLSQIQVVSVGDSNSLKVGQQVVAIGNALGYGQSVTTGIVSALNRGVTSGTDSSGNAVTSTYIQTDAAINPGNSGGALLNMNGELIGINTAKTASTDVEGMGYAIPISNVWETIQNLMTQTTSTTVVYHPF